ncbi:MAG TPA: proton-conducting transporter membrane subunit [Spirochaetota bacterium]|nr:proton-conducting transporter membrane subunit [Spirochaetota bacterium]
MVNPVLLIAVPLASAFLIPIAGLLSKKFEKIIPIAAMLFNFIISLMLVFPVLEKPVQVYIGGFSPPFCINLFAGPVAIFFSILISLVGLLISIYAASYIKKGATEKYHILYLLLLTGATGVVLTGDIFNLFVFFEILCISSYALVAYTNDKAGIEAAVKYLIQGALGSSLILLGIGFLYGKYGTLNMAHIAASINTITAASDFIPLVLLITGFGIEAAIFPLNAWLPDAHSSAPSTISAILSAIAIEVGLYAVLRIIFTLFGASSMLLFFTFLGLTTLLIGEMCAFTQTNIKRMLAYSSIGQIGLILFAFAMGTAHSITGGFFQLLSHTLGKALLFLSAGYMIYRSGSMHISSLQGQAQKMPYTAFAFTIGAFSLVGLPPFIGFPGKFMIIKAAMFKYEMLFTILAILVLTATIIEGVYFFKVVQALYFKGDDTATPKQRAPLIVLIPLFLFVLLIIGIGIYPKYIIKILNTTGKEFINRFDYIRGIIR